MTYDRITWVLDVLRAAGLTVVEHDGWRERGLSTSRPFTPRSVVWHHDASAPGDSPGVPASMIARFETAAAQLWVDRHGRWHIIASGRAPHAGATLPGKPTNYDSIGVETDHTSGEPWPPALLASLRKGTAAILKHLGVSAATGLHFHKTICSPPGRKVDPADMRLSAERARVGAVKLTISRRPKISLSAVVASARRGWRPMTPRQVVHTRRLKRALKAEGLLLRSYSTWQRRLGYTGADANGIPGKASLTALGRRRGFEVVA